MTDNEITLEARRLVDKIKMKYPDFVGKTISESDIEKLEVELKLKLPNWYIELYTTVPLIDTEFGIQEFEPDENYDGISYMICDGVDDIIEESTSFHGISCLGSRRQTLESFQTRSRSQRATSTLVFQRFSCLKGRLTLFLLVAPMVAAILYMLN